MGKKLFVGNLAFTTSSDDLRALFATAGACESAVVISDRATGRSRGFGFVEMASDDEANRAIAAFNGQDLQGRTLAVSEARERSERGFTPRFGPPLGYADAMPPPGGRFRKEKGSRRGVRGRKRGF